MNAKKIKDILISYIKASQGEVRIYQEKSIGNSICDVMAVTDRLIGYEIKSDLDNYTRLQSQINAYSTFFDENYLVVGKSHVNSATNKVPLDWGILCVTEDDILPIRKAKINKSVSKRKQLSILWKLELKNILIKNDMPMYAQKEKGYIADQIAANIDKSILGKQIAEELLNRDYSIYDATDYTEYSAGKGTNDIPVTELVDMLSEKNLSDFTLDQWIGLYKKAKVAKEKKDVIFKKTIPKRTTHSIPYTDIEVSLGVPWVSAEIINDFIYHLLNKKHFYINGELYKPNYVEHETITGNWFISDKKGLGSGNSYAEGKYGLERYNALYILEATLNLREIKIFDKDKVYNEKDTLAALEKQKLIKNEFKRWVWEDEDRRWLIEEAYNKMFSKYTASNYDGSHLKFENMSESYELYPYQKDAVQRILNNKNTLLAFDVGAGKTYIMIAAAMKMRQEGISRKNLFVVPNHIVGQWEKIFEDLYPKAKILAIEPKTFKPQTRQKVLKQIQNADYDGIIIAYSCFEMIPLSTDNIIKNMSEKLKRIELELNNLKTSYGYYSPTHNSTILLSERKRIDKLTQEFIESMTPANSSDITFEKLEIDTLFLDEAHNYKNLPIKTRLKNLRGINTKGSPKCQNLLHKVRIVQQNGRGVVFATGTPLCNSISDAYAMQIYLQYEEMKELQLDVFDNWVKTFASAEQLCEIDVDTSKFRFVTRFSRFFNLPELSAMFSQIAIFYANTSIEDLPKSTGYTDVIIEKNKPLSDYMKSLANRTEFIRSGMIARTHDNMLKVSTDGRKAALDLTLVGEKQTYDKHSKIFRCVENVVNLYNKDPLITQLIFCDYSTPKADKFNVYHELKNRLVEKGISKKDVVFIHNYQTESKKIELFRKFNAGEIRILIGSTFKLGIGANVQKKLKAIHHLDVPWRPADMVQREGRIIRKGNENKSVQIFRYISTGSFDAYAWQILETKQRFISQFLSGSTYQRTASDLQNEVLTYAEVKALALSQPSMKQLAEKENELKNLKVIQAQSEETHNRILKECKQLEERINNNQKILAIAYKHSKYLKNISNQEYSDDMKILKDMLTAEVISGEKTLSKTLLIVGFSIVFPQQQNEKKPYIYLEKDSNRYTVMLGDSTVGNVRRIVGKLKHFDKVIDEIKKSISSAQLKLSNHQQLLEQGEVNYHQQIEKLQSEIYEIQETLEIQEEE